MLGSQRFAPLNDWPRQWFGIPMIGGGREGPGWATTLDHSEGPNFFGRISHLRGPIFFGPELKGAAMARFMGVTRGRKGPGASRLGNGNSGITTHANGWDAGVTVYGRPNMLAQDKDTFQVLLTGGSNDYGEDAFRLGELRETPSGRVFVLSEAAMHELGAETDVIRL